MKRLNSLKRPPISRRVELRWKRQHFLIFNFKFIALRVFMYNRWVYKDIFILYISAECWYKTMMMMVVLVLSKCLNDCSSNFVFLSLVCILPMKFVAGCLWIKSWICVYFHLHVCLIIIIIFRWVNTSFRLIWSFDVLRIGGWSSWYITPC